jgi:ISXO2-like transposase domain/Transposase zinc-ribbon domain
VSMNRVQFQPGLSMTEFEQRYGSETQCEQAVRAWRWPHGFSCPRCGSGSRTEFRRGQLLYLQCSACQYQCSLIAGTIFASTKLALKTWFQAMHLLTKAKTNVSALELMRDLGVSYRSAWLIKHKLMEIDDSYLGGERVGGKPGRGSENKVPFVAAVQTTEDGQAVLACLALRPFTNASMLEFAARSLVRPLTVVSDGLACFATMAAHAGVHDRNVTGGGAAAAKHPKFRAVNTILGNLKTALRGAYKAFKYRKYGHRYLAEFQYRFNRRFNLPAILRRLAIAAVNTKPRPERVIRRAEVST